MPNRDGTGPRGKGPRTGRGLGRCGSKSTTTSVRPRLGLGRGLRQRRRISRR